MFLTLPTLLLPTLLPPKIQFQRIMQLHYVFYNVQILNLEPISDYRLLCAAHMAAQYFMNFITCRLQTLPMQSTFYEFNIKQHIENKVK